MTSQPLFVGIDVSKARLDTALRPDGRTFSDRKDPNGIAALVTCLLALQPALIVLEATDGYHMPLAASHCRTLPCLPATAEADIMGEVQHRRITPSSSSTGKGCM
jgi:transposase